MRPVFSRMDKLRRLVWLLTWRVMCWPTPRPMHRWRCFVLRCFGARLGKDNFIYPDASIWAPWLLETGDVVTLGSGCEIYNPGGAIFGHHTIISQDAYICGATHDYNSREFTYTSKKVETGPYVWICARATVMPGVYCGEGSVLGAAGVSSRNLEAWTVYAGNPAKAVKSRRWRELDAEKSLES